MMSSTGQILTATLMKNVSFASVTDQRFPSSPVSLHMQAITFHMLFPLNSYNFSLEATFNKQTPVAARADHRLGKMRKESIRCDDPLHFIPIPLLIAYIKWPLIICWSTDSLNRSVDPTPST
jgi:hypothetical protein